MILPVARSIAELFDSRPGPTANRLGGFLIAGMYQGSAVACAMFLTGQASNVLGANLALKLVNVEVTWASWFVAAVVPGLLSCAVVPWVAYRCLRPTVTRTPEAPLFAQRELTAMGPLTRDQWIVLLVFAGVGLMWITTAWHRLDVTFVALAGLSVLLMTGTAHVDDGGERALGPEVSLVAILDADKEGFLRSERSLIQTTGRAARNVNGEVIFYADKVTGSMKKALDETNRRRAIQEAHNQKMGITPETIKSSIKDITASIYEADYWSIPVAAEEEAEYGVGDDALKRLDEEMKNAAKNLEFERAAVIRDKIKEVKKKMLEMGVKSS